MEINIRSLIRNFVSLVLFSIMVFMTSITIAILITRMLPLALFLSSNAGAINQAQGAQFVSNAYPGLLQPRFRWDPMMSMYVCVCIARKFIKPLDGLLNRLKPQNFNDSSSDLWHMKLPETDTEVLGGINDLVNNRRISKIVFGRVLNIFLSLLFLIIVAVCIFITVLLLKRLVYSGNSGFKQLLRIGAKLSEEIIALPATVREIYEVKDTNKKKATSSRAKK